MAAMKQRVLDAWDSLTQRLRGAGETIPRLVMRIVMGWEFWESGLEKYNGQNWFADIQDRFPTPFNVIPADLSWGIATWFELIGAVALWLGLGTRFFAFGLLFLNPPYGDLIADAAQTGSAKEGGRQRHEKIFCRRTVFARRSQQTARRSGYILPLQMRRSRRG